MSLSYNIVHPNPSTSVLQESSRTSDTPRFKKIQLSLIESVPLEGNEIQIGDWLYAERVDCRQKFGCIRYRLRLAHDGSDICGLWYSHEVEALKGALNFATAPPTVSQVMRLLEGIVKHSTRAYRSSGRVAA